MKRQTTHWEKIFTTSIRNAENSNNKKITWLEYEKKTWTDTSLKKIYKWQRNTLKKCSNLPVIREMQVKTTPTIKNIF